MNAIAELRRALEAHEEYRIVRDGRTALEVRDAGVWGSGVFRIETPHGRIYADSARVLRMAPGAYCILGYRGLRPSGFLMLEIPEEASA